MAAERRSAEQKDAYGWANGHPPAAAKVVLVDFDQTIFEWGGLIDPDKQPLPGAVAAMQKLKARGYTILICTSRLTQRWLRDEYVDPVAGYQEQVEYLTDILDANGIPFDELTGEKAPAEALFDDKVIRVSEESPLDAAVLQFLGEYFYD